MNRRKYVPWTVGAILTVALASQAITYFETEVKCPLSGTKNTFLGYASWGNYVYRWPSKYQFVFWPYTDGTFLHHCHKCHYTAFAPAFEKLADEKKEAVRAALGKVTDHAKHEKGYQKLSMSERLRIAEQVYRVLEKDDTFWCHFYRVQGYHLDQENKPEEAAAARQKALELATQLLRDEKRKGERKEFFLIAGAMRHFLKDNPGALAELEAAATLKFERADLKPEQNENYNAFLDELIKDYISAIREGRDTSDRDKGH